MILNFKNCVWTLPFIFLSTLSYTEAKSNFNLTEVLNWEAPSILKKVYPYYLSGHDNEGAPVWILELGKWDMRSFLEENGDKYATDTEKYVTQMCTRFTEPELFSKGDEPQTTYNAICNMDTFGIRQVAHIPSVEQFLSITRIFVAAMQRKNFNFKHAYVVNSNYVFQTMYTLIGPIIGRIAGVVQVHGTDSSKWKPILLKDIPKDQLPPAYGGPQDFVPFQTFG